MKFGFVTCVQLGLSCMEAIYDCGGELSLVITLTDEQAKTKSGRVYLDDFCSAQNIPLLKSTHVNNADVIRAIQNAEIDWLFIIGWSQIASGELLRSPALGVLGMHPTLLPEGRGRAAIPWAILKGLEKTGVTMFKLDEGVDTGLIAGQIEIPLSTATTATELYQSVDESHVELMKTVFPKLCDGSLEMHSQDESKASEWPGRKPEDGEINLHGSVEDAERLIRAVTRPYPGAFFYENGKKFVVWSAKIVDQSPNDNDKLLAFSDGLLMLVEYEEHEC